MIPLHLEVFLQGYFFLLSMGGIEEGNGSDLEAENEKNKGNDNVISGGGWEGASEGRWSNSAVKGCSSEEGDVQVNEKGRSFNQLTSKSS